MPETLGWPWRDYPREDDPKDRSDRTTLVPEDAPKDMAPRPPAVGESLAPLSEGPGWWAFRRRDFAVTVGRLAVVGANEGRAVATGRGPARSASRIMAVRDQDMGFCLLAMASDVSFGPADGGQLTGGPTGSTIRSTKITAWPDPAAPGSCPDQAGLTMRLLTTPMSDE